MDIYREKWIILMGIGFTVVYTLIYIKFMDYCAFCISWFSIILIQVAFVGIGTGVYLYGQDLETEGITSSATWCNFLAWTFWILSTFYCVCLVVNCKAIRISFAVIETAGDYFAQTKRIILVPMMFFIIGICLFFIWMFGIACV